MAVVRGYKDMYEKYTAKYSGANVTSALTAVKPLMEAIYEVATTTIYDIVERTRSVLTSKGVPSTLWSVYLSFAQKLAAKTFSFGGVTLAKEAAALKAEWITAHGADSSIIDELIELITGEAPGY